MCPELKNKDILKSVLKQHHERSLAIYQDIDDEDDFQVNVSDNTMSFIFNLPGSPGATLHSPLHHLPAVPLLPRLLQPTSDRSLPLSRT